MVTGATDVRLSIGGINPMSCAKRCSHGLGFFARVLGGNLPSHLRTMACARDANAKRRKRGCPLRREYSIWMICNGKGGKARTLSAEFKPAAKEIMVLHN